MVGVHEFKYDWNYFFGLFTSEFLYKAALVTISLAVVSWILGNIVGFLLALAQNSNLKILKIPSLLFIWVFRGTPLLVQIIICYDALPVIFPTTAPLFANPFVAGALALILNEAAFSAEIIRAGLMSVDKGQIEAGKALGMQSEKIMRHIILKQALRVIIPPAGNEFVNVMKNTALVSVISLTELTLASQQIFTSNYKVIETLLASSMYYLVLTTGFMLLQQFVEIKMDVNKPRRSQASFWRRLIQIGAQGR